MPLFRSGQSCDLIQLRLTVATGTSTFPFLITIKCSKMKTSNKEESGISSAQRLSCPQTTLPVPCRALWSVHYGTWLSHSLLILTVVICLPSKRRHLFQSCRYLGWFHVDTHGYISEFMSWAWRLHGFFTLTCKPCLVFTYFSVQPSFHPQHVSHPLPKCSDGPLVFFTCQRDSAGSTKLSPCPEPVSNISAQCYKRKSHQHRDCCLCKLSVSKLEWCPPTPYCFLFLSVLLPAGLFGYYQ